ncbi:MAG: hypothetical protein V3W01_01700 [Dehalococcoidales bacterium]
MCWNCGCMMPDNDMGSPDNITTETLRRAARAGGEQEPQGGDDYHGKDISAANRGYPH